MRCVLYRSPVSDFLLKSDGQALAECLPWTGAVPDDQPDDILKMAVGQLDEYFSGARGLFSVPLAYGDASPFAKDVYDSLRTVAAGASVTYGQLAAMSGHERAARAVGGAMNRNRLLLFVPCHRVLASDGPGGFGCGIEMKIALLDLERRLYGEDRA